MQTTGYLGKPLIEKLGFKPDERVNPFNAPEWFVTYLVSGGITITGTETDWLHGFFINKLEINKFLKSIEEAKKGFWVSWPKKSAGVETDLTEQTFRDIILPLGWVDTKVCAIDETWSGLKFLRRKYS